MQSVLVAWLRYLMDDSLADSIVGDLEELRARRTGSSVRADVWWWRTAVAIVVTVTAGRLRQVIRDVLASAVRLPRGSGELRHAVRSLRRAPWYSVTVIGVIALAMTLATTVFAVVDGVLFKPLPYERSSELYDVSGGFQKGQRAGVVVAPRNLRDWAAACPGVTVTAIMAGSGGAGNDDLRGWRPVRAYVDQQFFDVLGIQPLVGGFSPQDFESLPNESPAIISYGLWQSAFSGRPDVVGQTLPVPGQAGYRVAGVLPREFLFPVSGRFQPNVLEPLVIPATERNELRYRRVTGLARLPSTMPLSEYQTRMDAAAVAEAVDWVPRANDGTPVFDHVGLIPIETQLTGQQRPVFLLVFATAAALVLLGCLNVSDLMASRVQDRARELAVRRALGAGWGHVVRLLLVESAVIAVAGGVIGIASARPLIALTLRLWPDNLGLLKPTPLDWRVVVFVLGMSAVSSVVTSLWPIRRSRRASAAAAMADGGQPTARVRSLGRQLIVVAQVALGLVLTLGGALLVGSLVRVWRTDPGFQADRVVLLAGSAPGLSLAGHAQAVDAFANELRRLPGVAAVGATESPLLNHSGLMNTFVDGRTFAVTSGFFEAAGLTLLDGRWLTPAEIGSGTPVAVVSERVAKRIAPGQRVVGRQIKGYRHQVAQPFTIVGVVADARFSSWDEEMRQGQVYGPYLATADDQLAVNFIVRANDRPRDLITLLLRQLTGRTDGVRIRTVATAEDLLDETVRGRRLNSWLFGAFAIAALVIVGVGVLGLMAMTTARRTREIGIRMALGARRDAVVRLFLGEQLLAVLVGLGLGGLISIWAVTCVSSYLYQLTVYDPLVWAAATGLILATAVVGALIPSLRASRLDPVKALRVE